MPRFEDIFLEYFLHAIGREYVKFIFRGESSSEREFRFSTGQIPPKLDTESLRRSYRQTLKQDQDEVDGPIIWKRDTKWYFSSTGIDKLKRIAVEDMKINVIAKGAYLLLRTIEEAHYFYGVHTLVEDKNGYVFPLIALNFISTSFESTPEDILPVGTVLIVKEPHLKTVKSKSYYLCCESPSDIIVLEKHHKLYNELVNNVTWKTQIIAKKIKSLNNLKVLKKLASKYFDKGLFYHALGADLKALHLSADSKASDLLSLHSNLTLTYIELGYYELALDHATKALQYDSSNIKSMYRAGIAFYQLRNFREAKSYFERLLEIDPDNEEGALELSKCLKRVEEKNGKIDIYQLYLKTKHDPVACIDCADFEGPLKVIYSDNNSRSVVATHDIIPGTLLVSSKALFVSNHKLGSGLYKGELFNHGELADAVRDIAQLVLKNPRTFGSPIYSMLSNKSPLHGHKIRLFCDEETETEPIVDVDKIREVLTSRGITLNSYHQPVGLIENECVGTGFFLFPSNFNHNCLPNTYWTTFGDVLVIHASRHIKAMEEITISYIDPMISFFNKQEALIRRGFSCTCPLCTLDASGPFHVLNKRKNAIEKVLSLFGEHVASGYATPEDITILRNLLCDIQQTYQDVNRKEICLGLAMPYAGLATLLTRYGNDEESLKFYMKAVIALGFNPESLSTCNDFMYEYPVPSNAHFTRFLLFLLEMIVILFDRIGDTLKAKNVFGCLIAAEKVLTGASMRMIKNRFKHVPSHLF